MGRNCFSYVCFFRAFAVLIIHLYITIMKKDLLVIAIKVAIYALGLVAAYLGVTSLSSCTYSRSTIGEGRATIITTDTTFIQHSGVLKTK